MADRVPWYGSSLRFQRSRVDATDVRVGWFLERGYEVIAKHPYGPLGELFLKTSGPNQCVWFLEGEEPHVELVEGKVVVDLYWNLWCSDCAYGYGRNGLTAVREACAELGELVLLREHELDRATSKLTSTQNRQRSKKQK